MYLQANLVRRIYLLATIAVMGWGLLETDNLCADDAKLLLPATAAVATRFPDPMASITIGPRERFGKKSTREKAAQETNANDRTNPGPGVRQLGAYFNLSAADLAGVQAKVITNGQ